MRGPDHYFIQIIPAEQPLAPRETGDYIIQYEGTISYRADLETDDRETVGVVSGFLIDGNRAVNDQVDLMDQCDAENQTVAGYAAAFFDPNEGGFKKRIVDLFEDCSWGLNLLVLDHIAISPAHRGQRLGLLAARRFIDVGSVAGGLVAIEPNPLQFRATDIDPIEYSSHPEQDRARATRKLARYWARLGFKQLLGTPYYALSPDFRQPTFEQLLGSGTRAPSTAN